MDYKNNIIEAHKWLKQLKANKKLSNNVIGSHINYSAPGILNALKNSTLSIEQIQVIAKKYDLLNDLNNKLDNFNISEGPSEEHSNKGLEEKVSLLEEKVSGLQLNFKMLYDQLLFLQNSWVKDRNEKNEKESG